MIDEILKIYATCGIDLEKQIIRSYKRRGKYCLNLRVEHGNNYENRQIQRVAHRINNGLGGLGIKINVDANGYNVLMLSWEMEAQQ